MPPWHGGDRGFKSLPVHLLLEYKSLIITPPFIVNDSILPSAGKHKELLNDEDVNRWFKNLSKGSVILSDVYLRSLGRFCDQIKTTPKQFAKMPLKKMEDITQDFIDNLESLKKPSGEPKYSPGYIESYLKAIRSWAEWNRKRFIRKIKISNVNKRPTLINERSPTREELKKVLYSDGTPNRTRVSIALIAFSGFRLEVLGNYQGLDGLTLKDFPDIKIENNEVVFSKIPSMIIVREELSKSRNRYISFLGEEGCEILKQYLERRISEGESLHPDSGIIITTPSQALKSKNFNIIDNSPFLRTTKIGDEIRKSMRICGLPWRPYVFRTYFDTALMLAENKGFISHAYQQFWMGHKGDIEAQYTTNKNRFPEEVIEDMRSSYKKLQDLLQTSKSEVNDEKIKESFRMQLLSVAGFSQQEIDEMKLTKVSDDEFQSKVKQKLLGVMANNGSKQKVVPINEVEHYISQGWEYVNTLPNDQAILKIPF